MKRYEVETYVTQYGKVPFVDWLNKIRDKKARIKIYARIERARFGNFGDWKYIKNAKGLYEMREHYSQGYRIYYHIVGQKIILLLAGSDKKDQSKTISKAKEYLSDYYRRVKDE